MELKEKIALLKSKLAELHSEYIETKSEYNTTKNNLEKIIQSLDHSENFELKIKMVREMISKELEFMRTRIAIIRTVSPITARKLEDLVKDFENQQNQVQKIFVDRYNSEEDKKSVTVLATSSIKLNDPDISNTIDLCLLSIKEILEKLEESTDR